MRISPTTNCCINCKFGNESSDPSASLYRCSKEQSDVFLRFGCHHFARKPMQNKYGAKKVCVDNVFFDSIIESKYYLHLKQLKKNKVIDYFLMQVPLILDGGTIYKVDFQVFWTAGGVSYKDVKGVLTKEFKIKKREVEAKYGLDIELVYKGDF